MTVAATSKSDARPMDSAATGPRPNASSGPRPNAATPARALQRPPPPPSQQEMRRHRQGQQAVPGAAQKDGNRKRKVSASPVDKNAPPLHDLPPETTVFNHGVGLSTDEVGGDPLGASQRAECKAQGSTSARKVQKADREKMRRDKLNEQFQDLGNALDPDRPRNDKATILGDTIQMLKDLTTQVNKLKAEYTSLSEEAGELTQEKNELRDEKASLKSEVDNLNNQYQQRMRVLYPWAGMEPSVVMGPPPAYPYPVPVPIPSGAVPMHPQLQTYPFFHSQTSGTIPNACIPYMAYTQPCHPPIDQPPNQLNTPVAHSSSHRSNSPAQDCRSKSSTLQQPSCEVRSSDVSDIATDLELKTPGSSCQSHAEIANNDSSSDLKTKKHCIKQIDGCTLTESSSSRCSSSGPPDVSNSDVDE